jgi:hypothetical protein
MKRAARWLGKFHQSSETIAAAGARWPLRAYDLAYCLEWARRTERFSTGWPARIRWLPTVCERFQDVVPLLFQSPPAVIHGAFFPENVLLSKRGIFPLHWDQVGVGAGEIDLACLTDRCRPGRSKACVAAYVQARWPNGAPAEFEHTLMAARLYLAFRQLGAAPGAVKGPDDLRVLRQLRTWDQRLGLFRDRTLESGIPQDLCAGTP